MIPFAFLLNIHDKSNKCATSIPEGHLSGLCVGVCVGLKKEQKQHIVQTKI
jgi:hypothetical protein